MCKRVGEINILSSYLYYTFSIEKQFDYAILIPNGMPDISLFPDVYQAHWIIQYSIRCEEGKLKLFFPQEKIQYRQLAVAQENIDSKNVNYCFCQ